MAGWLIQVTGLLVLVAPLVVIQWDLDNTGGGSGSGPRPGPRRRRHQWPWRLELYSNHDDITPALIDEADVPFPARRVRSSKAEQARFSPSTAWARPRVELDVDVVDPFSDEVLHGLLGHGNRVRFVSGNEAVVDTSHGRIRIRAVPSPL